MVYLDSQGVPIEDKGVYVTLSGKVVILYREKDDFIAKRTPYDIKVLHSEFAKNLTRITDPCDAARFILSELEGITVDGDDNLPI